MSLDPLLKSRLEAVLLRERRRRVWWKLAACWAAAGLVALGVFFLGPASGATAGAWPWVGLFGLIAVFLLALRTGGRSSNWRQLAKQIEARYPELNGRLLTAVQQDAAEGQLGYLQRRLIEETLRHAQEHDWTQVISIWRVRLAQAAHWGALVFLVFALFELRPASARKSFARRSESAVTVSPGDASIERGTPFVVLARFGGALPPSVDWVLGTPTANKRMPLVKSLADPMFGGSIPEALSNFVYHIEYGGKRTRDFKVTVFEYPRLERADADVAFPPYTGQPPKHIANTLRVSAVEGSKIDLTLHFNKPVAKAELVVRDRDHPVIPLAPRQDGAGAVLPQFLLESSQTYALRLVDAEGRTNKIPAQFVFEALSNRPPEIHLASPRGDQRPSPLEEISFEGTVWDDFGVKSYGLGYAIGGEEPKYIELGRGVPAAQKQSFKHLLGLEALGVHPDELISWFVWADDVGPDGQVRRTMGDLFFGEVRPFEEVFREGQGMESQGQNGQSGEQGSQSSRLAELQKQIISATWKLQRETPSVSHREPPASAEPQSRNDGSPGQKENRGTPAPASTAAEPSEHATFADPARILPLLRRSQFHLVAQLEQSPLTSPDTELPPRPPLGATAGKSAASHSYSDDAAVVRDAQGQALEQAQTALERQRDSRTTTLWRTATEEMERALDRLRAATNSPAELKDALAAEQAAYQALLRLQEHEYQVARSRNRNQQSGGRSQQMQRQLEEMDLTQSENRYETQSEAQRPPASQRREQLQVMNRLQELARRQQDLNDRLKELQTALQEAKTPEERAEIQRRLKRLQEEEQQMLADLDETSQRMDRPENQSSMAEERRQMEQTRNDVQRAAEAAGQGAASEALAAGTRAQQQLQQSHDQLRRQNSSQFSEDLRQMRSDARELAREQDRIQQQMEQQNGADHKSLSDAQGAQPIKEQLAQQKQKMTNLVERATEISQQAEQAEPLLSKQLYDTVRKFGQDTTKDMKDVQDELLSRGLMTQRLYDELKDSPEPDAAKLLDLTSDLVNRNLLSQANQSAQRARSGIETLKEGVERAAESVLGDDTEALRLAQQELNQLTQELGREMAQGSDTNGLTNSVSAPGRAQASGAGASSTNAPASNRVPTELAQAQGGEPNQASGATAREGQSTSASSRGQPGTQAGQPGEQNPGASAQANRNGSGRLAQNDQQGRAGREGADNAGATGGNGSNGGGAGGWNGNLGNYLNRFLNDGRLRPYGPLTGEDFVNWADRLRDVEEMLDDPTLRNQVAQARERARLLRQDFKRDRKKPDWDVVQLQVMQPLAEVRQRIADELARRDSREALVPIDRDPVPDRYSELVRRYYEELGKQKQGP